MQFVHRNFSELEQFELVPLPEVFILKWGYCIHVRLILDPIFDYVRNGSHNTSQFNFPFVCQKTLLQILLSFRKEILRTFRLLLE